MTTHKNFSHLFCNPINLENYKKQIKAINKSYSNDLIEYLFIQNNEEVISMSGWYEISLAKDGQNRFVLKDGNGEVILKAMNKAGLQRKNVFITSRTSKMAQFNSNVRNEFFQILDGQSGFLHHFTVYGFF